MMVFLCFCVKYYFCVKFLDTPTMISGDSLYAAMRVSRRLYLRTGVVGTFLCLPLCSAVPAKLKSAAIIFVTLVTMPVDLGIIF